MSVSRPPSPPKTTFAARAEGATKVYGAGETEVRALITEAADFATADAEPAASELWTDIYAA